MILVIDHYDSFIFNIIDIVQQYGHDVHHVFYDKVTINDIERLNPDKIILSPGPKHPDDALHSQKIIRHFGEKNIPILGVCLGHQLIGCAYGAKIEKNDPAHGISEAIEHNGRGLFRGIKPMIKVGRYHSLSVSRENFPDDMLNISAFSADHMIMGIYHKEYPIYGVQFHPESILTEHGKEIICNLLNI